MKGERLDPGPENWFLKACIYSFSALLFASILTSSFREKRINEQQVGDLADFMQRVSYLPSSVVRNAVLPDPQQFFNRLVSDRPR
ncbi:hypothetical protein HYS97_00170 [Candidatus Daviesbacteria bacterium]|nr:hypothetical protein [Candidatus Daviesbacteria bacterium]